MSKIALFDSNMGKFTDCMFLNWEKDGHEVKRVYSYDPNLVDWADIIWIDCCDKNAEIATRQWDEYPDWWVGAKDMTNKRVIIRAIDIECWCGLHNQVDWNYVDDVIFVAPHIKKLVEKDIDFKTHNVNVHLIPCGVDMDKFTFRKDPVNTKKIVWVAERWYAKGIDYFLQYAAMLYKAAPEYKIYAVGIWADNAVGGWYGAYIDYFIEHNPMNVEFIDSVPDMNEFLEDKSHTICFSKKEAFSYAIAEGMSKGLKPIIHRFYGCDAIWPKRFVWNMIDEAIEMTLGEYNPESYRLEIKQYSLDKMLKAFDGVINET